MPHLLDQYARVSAELPCPKCGKFDYCMVHKSGRKCVCTRVKSGKKFGRKGAGYIHYVGGDTKPVAIEQIERKYLTTLEVQAYLDSITSPYDYSMLRTQGNLVQLPLLTLNRFGVRYETESAALVFPMFNESGAAVGCRFRRADGRKWSLTGGKEGVFKPVTFDPALPSIIIEGATDAATAHSIGLQNVLGRPNCAGALEIITNMYVGYETTPIVIIADDDFDNPHGNVGVDGAVTLANTLPNPTIVITGTTDLREYKRTANLQTAYKSAILESLRDCGSTCWQPVFRNRQGEFFDFTKAAL